MGTIESRPAMSETRCWDERLRGLGMEGERDIGGRAVPPLSPLRLSVVDSGVVDSETAEERGGERETGELHWIGSDVTAPRWRWSFHPDSGHPGVLDREIGGSSETWEASTLRRPFSESGSMKLPLGNERRHSSALGLLLFALQL